MSGKVRGQTAALSGMSFRQRRRQSWDSRPTMMGNSLCLMRILLLSSTVEICMLTPDSALDKYSRHWETRLLEGSWIPGVSAGGCRNNHFTFWTNPQYRVIVEDPVDDNYEDPGDLVVCLMQKNRRKGEEETHK